MMVVVGILVGMYVSFNGNLMMLIMLTIMVVVRGVYA